MAEIQNTVSGKSVGIEISRDFIRICVLGADGTFVDYAEASRGEVKSSDSLADLGSILKSLWTELGLGSNVNVGVAIGSRFSGVGSGPKMHTWLDSLEKKLSQKIARVGKPNTGISYAPMVYVEQVKSVVEQLSGVNLIEVAPISVARLLGSRTKASFEFSSSVSWKARVHSGVVLEAVASKDYNGKNYVQVVAADGLPRPISNLSGYFLDEQLIAAKNLNLSKLAVSLGVAIGVRTGNGLTDLARVIDIESVSSQSLAIVPPIPPVEDSVSYIDLSEPSVSVVPPLPPVENSWPAARYASGSSFNPTAVLPQTKPLVSEPVVTNFIDLTQTREAHVPSVPPATHMIPTNTQVQQMPPMPSEQAKVVSVGSFDSLHLQTIGKPETKKQLANISEDSILRVLFWLVGIVFALFVVLALS